MPKWEQDCRTFSLKLGRQIGILTPANIRLFLSGRREFGSALRWPAPTAHTPPRPWHLLGLVRCDCSFLGIWIPTRTVSRPGYDGGLVTLVLGF